jgi:hypothetical protein
MIDFLKELLKKTGAFILSLVKRRLVKRKDIYFLSFTNNQKKTCEHLINFFDSDSIVGNYSFGIRVLPEFKAFYFSLRYSKIVYSQIKPLKINPKFLWEFFLIPGYLKFAQKFLMNESVKGFVTSNDHNYQNRCFITAARLTNKTSIYIQHASVSEYFPRLQTTFALLEGEDAANKYLQIGKTDTTILLVGRVGIGILKNQSTVIDNYGYCFNDLDDSDEVLDTISKVLLLTKNLLVRPHPHEPRTHLLNEIKKMSGVTLSDSKNESISAFLTKIDLLICGDSNVQLDAISHNVEVIYHSSSSLHSDYYGFIKNGLVKYRSKSVLDLISLLQVLRTKDKNIQLRSKFYDAGINSIMEGRIAELYALTVKQIFDGNLDFSRYFDEISIAGKKVYVVRSNNTFS